MSLLRTAGRAAVISATATSVSNRVSAKQHGRWAASTQPAPAASPAPPTAQPPPAPPPADSVTQRLDQLERLVQLKAQGALTDEEFDAQKKQILGA
jgi:hypothetical protein